MQAVDYFRYHMTITSRQAIRALGIFAALLMMVHGTTRLVINGSPDFGQFLTSKGFPFGEGIAWTLTFSEISFGVLMIAGRLTRLACLFFIAELLMGIILVHFKNGWFVVGLTEGGIEYSVLLIACFSLVALTRNTGHAERAKL